MNATGPQASPRRRHRAPSPDERHVDAARTKASLLEAALDEFSARGYAGARVRDIAARAGASKDSIGYHFGGKEGLYLAVQRAWLERRREFAGDEASIAERVSGHLHDALRDPRPLRLMAWRALAAAGGSPPDGAGRDHPFDGASIERRHGEGQIDERLDGAAVQLVLLGAVAAPVVFPDAARRLFDMDPASPAFEERYRGALLQVLGALGVQP